MRVDWDLVGGTEPLLNAVAGDFIAGDGVIFDLAPLECAGVVGCFGVRN